MFVNSYKVMSSKLHDLRNAGERGQEKRAWACLIYQKSTHTFSPQPSRYSPWIMLSACATPLAFIAGASQ
jgi:hypothetical protein